MNYLEANDFDSILESLRYTQIKFEGYPVGPNGYPSLDFKQQRLKEVADLIEKVKKTKAAIG